MSVTFFVCDADGQALEPVDFVASFEDDPDYGRIQTNQNPWEMNVANELELA